MGCWQVVRIWLILCPFRRIAACSPLWSMICGAAGSWLSKIVKYEVLSCAGGLKFNQKSDWLLSSHWAWCARPAMTTTDKACDDLSPARNFLAPWKSTSRHGVSRSVPASYFCILWLKYMMSSAIRCSIWRGANSISNSLGDKTVGRGILSRTLTEQSWRPHKTKTFVQQETPSTWAKQSAEWKKNVHQLSVYLTEG